MPIYGYTCEHCGYKFDRFVKSQAQAQCLRILPNSAMALCMNCNKIATRNLDDIHICTLTGDVERKISLIGKAVPDPVYDGELTVNAGRSYGVVLSKYGIDKPCPSGDNFTFTLEDVPCSCKFCTHDVKEENRKKDAENRQREIDSSIAEWLERAGATLDGISVDNASRQKAKLHNDNIQKCINDLAYDDTYGENDYVLPAGYELPDGRTLNDE
jgi:hypothetical protein